MQQHYLQPLFAPRSVALVGASPRDGSLGRVVLENIRAGGFKGDLYPVNPKHRELAGLRCVARLADIGKPVDLAVICTPATTVRSVLEDAAAAHVRSALVLSAGFGETGEAGKALEREIGRLARETGVRMIGPNCLGVMRPSLGLNATFARRAARRGPMALISQSGAVATAMVDWADSANIGFSSVVSMGAGADLDFGEILDFFVHDTETRALLLYIEGVREARRFLSALRAAARAKPVIALKVGRHLSGSRAAMSHTGALVGNDAVFDAALKRCGVLRVQRWDELFDAARLIDSGRTTAGNRLAIVTNGGGPGVMAADHAVEVGVELASLSDATRAALDAALPPHWSHANPVDIIGDADAKRLSAALGAVLADPEVDGVVTLFCPQRVLSSADAGAAIVAAARTTRKPVLTAWLGEPDVRDGRAAAEAAHLSVFPSPEPAVAAFGGLAQYARAQAQLLEVPAPREAQRAPDLARAQAIARAALAENRRLLTEPESKALLACFGIPTPQALVARSRDEALEAAAGLGYPVVLKILSRTIAHKSDVHGVRLGIADAAALAREYDAMVADVARRQPEAVLDGVVVQPMIAKRFGRELLIGIATDPVFGPVISFGSGGVAVERLADQAIGLPPLNARLAEALIDETRVARLLGAYRHIPAVRREALVEILLTASEMACALPWLAEMDINPVLADQDGAVALDCRVVIDPARIESGARYAHMAIHPYPTALEHRERLADGTELGFRPIRPEDAQALQHFVIALSNQSRYLRFFSSTRELSPSLLARLTQIDYDRELALVARTGETDGERIVGVARYSPNPDGRSCEFAVTVADDFQGHGLGRRLLERLTHAAADAGYQTMTGVVLKENDRMLALMDELGWLHRRDPEEPGQVLVERRLA